MRCSKATNLPANRFTPSLFPLGFVLLFDEPPPFFDAQRLCVSWTVGELIRDVVNIESEPRRGTVRVRMKGWRTDIMK